MGIEELTVGKVVHYVGTTGSCEAAIITHVWKRDIYPHNDARVRVFGYDPSDDTSEEVQYSEGKEMWKIHLVERCK